MSQMKRKIQVGIVVSDKMDKTIIVSIERRALDPVFKKYMKKVKKFKVHDEKNESHVGDVVEIVESKPISKFKNWRLQKILEKGEAFGEIDREVGS